MDLWSIVRFLLIPVLTVVITFLINRKALWIAPLISLLLAFITCLISSGSIASMSKISAFFGSNERMWYLFMTLLLNFGIVTILALFAYFIAYIFKRYNRKTQ